MIQATTTLTRTDPIKEIIHPSETSGSTPAGGSITPTMGGSNRAVSDIHGLFAPNARHRRLVVPAPVPEPAHDDAEVTGARTRASMTWAQRLRRVFAIDISRCPRCGAPLRVLAAITDPTVIAAILLHLESRAARAPPPTWH